MPDRTLDIRAVRPEVTEARGGWLALAPTGAPIRCGVTAATKAAAISGFEEAREAWADLSAQPRRLRVAN